MKDYHCCATCIHVSIEKVEEQGIQFSCSRLGYATESHYQFQCWVPKEQVKNLMDKQKK